MWFNLGLWICFYGNYGVWIGRMGRDGMGLDRAWEEHIHIWLVAKGNKTETRRKQATEFKIEGKDWNPILHYLFFNSQGKEGRL